MNNAGMLPSREVLAGPSPQQLDVMIDVNFRVVVHVTQAAVVSLT